MVLSREIRVLGVGRRMARLHQEFAQPRTSFTRLALEAFACTLIVAWTVG